MNNLFKDSGLWNEWVNVCDKYLKLFCDKHDYDYEDAKDSWVSNFNGTIVLCGDECVSMENIILDIELNAPEGEFHKWYWYCMDAATINEFQPNYYSWLKGCPTIDADELKRRVQKKLKEMFPE